MSRAARLACGCLLLIIAGLVSFLAGTSEKSTLNPLTLAAVFGLPGLLLLVTGILPDRRKRQALQFSAARLLGGLAISAAGLLLVYLFYNVLHVMPRILLIGAFLAVPMGVLFAATCWTEKDAPRRAHPHRSTRADA